MIPHWLIIAVGIAIILALAGPLLIGVLIALVAGLTVGFASLLDWALRPFYRWQHRHRLKSGYYRERARRNVGRRR